MPSIEEAKKLLRIAQRDLDALRVMQGSELIANEIFGFHGQQATEKALKAWLCLISGSYPYTHDLLRLMSLINDSGADMEPFWNLGSLSIYAMQARYEEDAPDDMPLERSVVIAEVGALLEYVGTLVGEA